MEPLSINDVINFRPLLWLHQSLVQDVIRQQSGIRQAILNSALMRKYSLDVITKEHFSLPKVNLFCENWFYLRQAAYYMACYRHRSAIMQSITWHSLSAGARIFMQCSLTANGAVQINHRYQINIEALACREVMTLAAGLPESVKKRVALMFNYLAEDDELIPSVDINLFSMALIHAKNYPI
ncbi:hypothetical protein J2X14_002126 [Pantoea alhagi]|uniref:hypothetical protein n=1 Tax=Mixta sp. BE291 TaxID=3158787 RepID=UPI00285C28C3|nr:hypothetical protein [Pantoea alhagi]